MRDTWTDVKFEKTTLIRIGASSLHEYAFSAASNNSKNTWAELKPLTALKVRGYENTIDQDKASRLRSPPHWIYYNTCQAIVNYAYV